MQKIDVVVLAGGLGKRMQSELPKVLAELHGKPLISYVLTAIKESGVCEAPVIVVGKKREMVMQALGDGYRYAIQEEQLGTGHAVLAAEELLRDSKNIMVVYGDMPYLGAETISALTQAHDDGKNALTMATVTVPDFTGVNAGFHDFGRIVRDVSGAITKIVEKKDATEAELNITELNTGFYCFRADWLWLHLKNLENANAQGEYYLTDLVAMAVKEGLPIASISIQPKEALGVNTKEHLELLHRI